MPAPARSATVEWSRPRSVPALLLLLVTLTLVAGGCRLDTPETDRAEAQTEKVLTEADVPVTLVSFLVTTESEGADDTITVDVLYDGEAPSTDRAQVAQTAARTIWRQSIAEVDTIVVRPGSSLETSEFTAPELEQRFGARPPGLVQVDAATMRHEQDEVLEGLFGLVLASMVPVLIGLILTLVIVVGLIVLVVVLVMRQQRPPPPPPPGPVGYGPGYPV